VVGWLVTTKRLCYDEALVLRQSGSTFKGRRHAQRRGGAGRCCCGAPGDVHVYGRCRCRAAVHRLDYRVGGLLLVAKTRRAEIALSAQFEQHTVVKHYRAVLVGRLDDAPLLDPSDAAVDTATTTWTSARAVRVTNQIDGKDATTSVLVRALTPQLSLDWLSTVDLWPLTGRWHSCGCTRQHSAPDRRGRPAPQQRRRGELPDVVRGLGTPFAVGLRFRDVDGNTRCFTIDEPPKFARFRHFARSTGRASAPKQQ
ncbi:hypothetical protein PINS_up015593, partial [Pythium insidiosum]